MKSYCLPFLLCGFEAVTLSGRPTNACPLDACIDRAVYKIFGLANRDNTAEVRTCLGLQSIRSVVCTIGVLNLWTVFLLTQRSGH